MNVTEELLQKYGYRPAGRVVVEPPASRFAGPGILRRGVRHLDARGSLFECYRDSWPNDVHDGDLSEKRPKGHGGVAQAYLSETLPGVAKGWHVHLQQTDRFVCVRGRVLVGLFSLRLEPRESRIVTEVVLDAEVPGTLTIPPGVAHGWVALGNEPSVVLNLVSREYDGSDEYRRDAAYGPVDGVAYDWHRRRDG